MKLSFELLRGDGSILQASFIEAGLQGRAFEESTGWKLTLEHYTHESGAHHISKEEAAGVRAFVASCLSTNPMFCGEFVERGKSKAGKLIQTTQSLENRELLDSFQALWASVRELVPFLAVRGLVQAELESTLIRVVADRLDEEDAESRAAYLLNQLFLTRQESEAAREVRSFYRIALELGRNPAVVDLIIDRSSPGALRTLEGDYPALHEPLVRHIDEYGWVRTRHSSLDPLTSKDLVQRLQKVFLRWKPATVARACEAKPRAGVEETLKLPPSPELVESIDTLEALITLRGLRVDALLHAQHLARGFFAKVAVTLECTPKELMLFTAEEIAAALAGTIELPRDEMEARAASQGAPAMLEGQSVSLGRAVGRVRIIHHAVQRERLELGDVLVTGLSSPDHGGDQSVFPTRTDASVPVEDAAAIIIDDGGLLSHAAMISREHGIPCVVGTERATSTLRDGQIVEVDATRAQGRIIPFEY